MGLSLDLNDVVPELRVGGKVVFVWSFCRFDRSVSCPFSSCIAHSIESCNLRSGRFTQRFSKPICVFIFSKHGAR
jgi:hypothetical protein